VAEPDFLTTGQLVKKYPFASLSLVYAACKAGRLPHYRVGKTPGRRGKYVIREADFLAWVESCRVGETRPEDGGPPKYPGGGFTELDAGRLGRAWRKQKRPPRH
jgi:hypothetical protein